MNNSFFQSIEHHKEGTSFHLNQVVDHLAFNEQGLIPVIVQDVKTNQVLMLAWMNKDTLMMTLNTKQMTYWSRTRRSIWKKGETSGNTQRLIDMSLDCDGDTLLCIVEQIGAACHTERPDCFYLNLDPNKNTVNIKVSPPANHTI